MTGIPTPDEHVDAMRAAIDGLAVTLHGATVERDAAIARAIRAALASADPLALLAALASDLSPQDSRACSRCGDSLGAEEHDGTCEAAPPATEPGPTERVDVALRFTFFFGVFVLPGEPPHVAKPEHYEVTGLRVRVDFSYVSKDVDAAEICARVWEARLRERGAREVEMVGEEAER